MTKSHIVAVVAGLLVTVSGPSLAASRMSHTNSAAKSHPHPAHSLGSVNSGSAIRDRFLRNGDNPHAPLGKTWPGDGAT
jgi:hypothetical protein